MKKELATLIRHGLTTGAGYLVGAGVIGASEVEMLVGAAMTIVALGWSFVQKGTFKRD